MPAYYQGYASLLTGDCQKAAVFYREAERRCPDYCFPNRIEEIRILKSAIEVLGDAPMTHYYLGCLPYDKKQYRLAASH